MKKAFLQFFVSDHPCHLISIPDRVHDILGFPCVPGQENLRLVRENRRVQPSIRRQAHGEHNAIGFEISSLKITIDKDSASLIHFRQGTAGNHIHAVVID
jgi:hypothetical protein